MDSRCASEKLDNEPIILVFLFGCEKASNGHRHSIRSDVVPSYSELCYCTPELNKCVNKNVTTASEVSGS